MLLIVLSLFFTSCSVIVPEYSKLFSFTSIPYALLVLSILFAIFVFSLSNLFDVTNIRLNPTSTINSPTKYTGITAKLFNTFCVFFV